MDNVHESDDIRATGEIAKDLDFPLNFLLCDGFQDLNDTRLFVG